MGWDNPLKHRNMKGQEKKKRKEKGIRGSGDKI